MKSIHQQIQENGPTCWIDYEEEFIIHVRAPFGQARPGYNPYWIYPCIYNNKQVKLIKPDLKRLGYGKYGTWGIHYI